MTAPGQFLLALDTRPSRPHRDPIVRSASVPDFPYRIIYFVTRDELVLIAYAHERRKPGYWKRRL